METSEGQPTDLLAQESPAVLASPAPLGPMEIRRMPGLFQVGVGVFLGQAHGHIKPGTKRESALLAVLSLPPAPLLRRKT